jgi:hypothetical protein
MDTFNALRLRFRLVASDFLGIVCILDGDRSSAVVLTRLCGGPGLTSDLIMKFSCPSEITKRPVMEAEPRSARSLEFQRHDAGLKEPLVLAGSAMIAQLTRW